MTGPAMSEASSTNAAMTGRCLCGEIRFKAIPTRKDMGVCHCGMCRRWTGGTFMAVDCGTDVEIENEDKLGVYSSSDWGERIFCSLCGTSLFWRMRDGSETVVAAQAFDDPGAFAFTSQIYIDEKPGNYDFANETRKMTGDEFLAAIMGPKDTDHA